MTALRRVEAWAEYTTALSRAIEAERRAPDGDSLAQARDRVNGLLWTTPEGYVLQNEHRAASVQAT